MGKQPVSDQTESRRDDSSATAAIVIIGNEILSGRTQDTNVHWIGEKLCAKGIKLREVRVVPDEEPMIVAAVNALRASYDYVFTTGGIGPTHDDITAACIASAFGVAYERHEQAYAVLVEHYGGAEHVTPPREKMAFMPRGAVLIPNPVSGAPGFYVDNVYVMAGIPRIMQAMFDYVIGILRTGQPIISHTVVCALPESAVAERMAEIQKRFDNVEVGSYPHFRRGDFGLSIVLRSTDRHAIEEATTAIVAMIRDLGDMPRALAMRDGVQEAINI